MNSIRSTASNSRGLALAAFLAAFSSFSFGQYAPIGLQLNLKVEAKASGDYFLAEDISTGSWSYDFRNWSHAGPDPDILPDDPTPTFVSMMSNVDLSEVVFENDLTVEAWMTSAFEISDFSQSDVFIESDLEMEAWMTTSFNLDQQMIQDESDLIQIEAAEEIEATEEIVIESWMVEPFFSTEQK